VPTAPPDRAPQIRPPAVIPAAPGRHRPRWVSALLVGLAVLIVAVAGVGGAAYLKLDSNIRDEQVVDRLGDRPGAAPVAQRSRPLNVLLIGSDSRAGVNAEYGSLIEGARADVTILLHLSADRRRAVAVSIPRDSVVDIPSCRRRDGVATGPARDLFNAAYNRAGSACTIRTVEALTGIYVDHHVVVDFDGFKHMVDALGTIRICVPRNVDDEKSGLRLRAGQHDVNGETALAYVRNRTLDTTGDIGRVQRQQAFLAAMIQKATSTGTLTNPTRLYRFLDAATKSVTTDPGLANLNALRKLATSVQGIGLDQITFLTVPFEPYPADPNRLQWSEAADELWRLLRADLPLPGAAPPAGTAVPSAVPSPAGRPTVRTSPERVRVRVLDGNDRPGLTSRAAAELRRAGFQVVAIGQARHDDFTRSVVRHDPGYDESGRTLASSVVGATTESTPELAGVLELIVGRDYSGVRDVVVAATPRATRAPAPTFPTRTAAEDVCG
jgi:LCP family protein required for cell wall assembly